MKGLPSPLLRLPGMGLSGRVAPMEVSLGYFFDFQPPALVFRQVPVDGVYLVAGEQVDDGFQLRDGTGIAAAVNHDAAPREARTVRDGHAGKGPVAGGILFQRLLEGLRRIESSGGRRA